MPNSRKILIVDDDTELRTIQYASVEGGEFLSAVVAELLGVEELVLEERLDKIGRVHVAEALSYLGTTHPPKPDQQAGTKHSPRSPLQSSQP